MFEIVKVNIKTNEDNSDNIYVEFISKDESYDNLKVKIKERIFQSCECEVTLERVAQSHKYWVEFNTTCVHSVNLNNGQLTSKFNNGFILEFLKENKILDTHNIEYILTDLEKIKNVENRNNPIIWILGDSNVAYTFRNLNENDLQYNNFTFKHNSIIGLSLNRFLTSDYDEMLKTLPIKETDVVCFLLGEIDLRKTILSTYKNKNLPLDYLLNNLIYRYCNFYNSFKIKHKNTFILSPNGVVRDKYVIDNFESIFEHNSETERINLWKTFNKTMSILLKKQYIDFTANIRDNDDCILSEFLVENNHHLKSNKDLLNNIYKHVEENYIP